MIPQTPAAVDHMKALIERDPNYKVWITPLSESFIIRVARVVRRPKCRRRGLGVIGSIAFHIPSAYWEFTSGAYFIPWRSQKDPYKILWFRFSSRPFFNTYTPTEEDLTPTEEDLTETLPAYSELVVLLKNLNPRMFHRSDDMQEVIKNRLAALKVVYTAETDH